MILQYTIYGNVSNALADQLNITIFFNFFNLSLRIPWRWRKLYIFSNSEEKPLSYLCNLLLLLWLDQCIAEKRWNNPVISFDFSSCCCNLIFEIFRFLRCIWRGGPTSAYSSQLLWCGIKEKGKYYSKVPILDVKDNVWFKFLFFMVPKDLC